MTRLVLVIATFCSLNLFCQDSLPDNYTRNELKLNVFYTLFGLPEISYERALNKCSSVGASLLIGATKNTSVGIGVFPFYRRYFGPKKPVCGFFLEGNGGIYTQEITRYSTNTTIYLTTRDEIQVGIGLGLGYKFEVHKIWTIETLGGFGRNFTQYDNNINNNEFYPRFGITIGRRF